MREKALAYLAAHNVMTLATQSLWAAAVFYANEGFALYFVSSPNSRHARDLAQDPRVAAAIHEDYHDWRAIQGLQLCGTVARLEGAARDAALACYRQKFPFLKTQTFLLEALGKAACYRLTPAEMYFVDNSVGFGKRVRVHLSK
jgi:uncharacterized protein YhbP (UPF0306 family)